MLTITLHSSGIPYEVGEHPYFMDYADRDIRERWDHSAGKTVPVSTSVVSVLFENALAPVLLEMDGRPVSDSVSAMPKLRGHEHYGGLETAVRFLRRNHSERQDGIRVGELLLGWAKSFPDATWTVTARDEEAEILRSRTLGQHVKETVQEIRPPLKLIVVEEGGKRFEEAVPAVLDATADRERHDPDACPLAGERDAKGKRIICSSCDAVTEADLQPATRSHGGGGSGGKKSSKVTRTSNTSVDDDGNDSPRTSFIGAKALLEVKSVLVFRRADDEPSVADYLERVGYARIAGAGSAEIMAALDEVISRHRKSLDGKKPKSAA